MLKCNSVANMQPRGCDNGSRSRDGVHGLFYATVIAVRRVAKSPRHNTILRDQEERDMAKEDWKTVDRQALINAIGDEQGDIAWTYYENAKQAYREYKALRQIFEAQMQDAFAEKLPTGMELKFGYNYGKLSIAVGPVSERKAQPKAESESLGDWLQGQASQGHRC